MRKGSGRDGVLEVSVMVEVDEMMNVEEREDEKEGGRESVDVSSEYEVGEREREGKYKCVDKGG